MANYTHRRCSDEAEELLKKYRYLAKNVLPIDVETLARKMGHPVHAFEAIYKDTGLKGTGFRKLPEDRLEIIIDNWHYDNEYQSAQFTIAEELAHLIIHEGVFKDVHTAEDRIEFEKNLSEGDYLIFDAQAKRYGSYLLMPNSLVISHFSKWIDDNPALIAAERLQDLSDFVQFLSDTMSRKLDVSIWVIQKLLWNRYINGERLIVYLARTCKVKTG